MYQMTIILTIVIIVGSPCSAASDRKKLVLMSAQAAQQPFLLGCNIAEGYVFYQFRRLRC
jgi:hypothetical protein